MPASSVRAPEMTGIMKSTDLILCLSILVGCRGAPTVDDRPFCVVLGIAQDAGFPQAACDGECCAAAWGDPSRRRLVACLGIVDPASGERWMIDCTPDFREQLRLLDELAPTATKAPGLAGVLLTHAHIGHYAGLVQLGHEAIGAVGVPVHAMPRMAKLLRTSGPWSQLVSRRNIEIVPLFAGHVTRLNERLSVTPIPVPHRDELSETVAFRVEGPRRSVLYLPDIDKWERWSTRIENLVADVDVAYLDATFHADGEVVGRSMADIPHPFIVESLRRFAPLPEKEREKVRFIHLNHTNPALDRRSAAASAVIDAGHDIARQGERVGL